MSPLQRLLLQELTACPDGRLSFSHVMEQALYHPEHGYYGPGPRRIGRRGDFYTSVSVGPFYGRLLAELARQISAEHGDPADFTVIEQAAHDGQLAEDVLSGGDLPYIIVEPNPRYEAVQRQRLANFRERVRWVSCLADLPEVPALFICNELPDAMPVHLVRWEGGRWQELYVCGAGESLVFEPGPPSPQLADELRRLPQNLPEGYTTEVNLAALAWMRELAKSPFFGAVYIADYGFDEPELYAPERTSGTLRRYKSHQTDDRVLEDLGESDLTSHVNFTRLSEVAAENRVSQRVYELQGRFLGKLGLPMLAKLEGKIDAPTKSLLRQYHSLTHPAFMGRSFRILMLDKS